ncbi:ABC transporter, CydDC-E family, permease/ATP-binding protein CydD [Polymorphum gilvum SL003B-26A1]|uniref:ABC transporter, CydDC-E family, permease/ATP-binding protein CydD n=2 Tax=Polymorphum TaxID=991903 RepID=F2J6C4_POLGS|nr:ABC transporter, CydDC-E family, permease/ATP-binding protein CydD [Polymorphum gilvum SL003B-26A1]
MGNDGEGASSASGKAFLEQALAPKRAVLRRAGTIAALADLLWIAQAAALAMAAGALVGSEPQESWIYVLAGASIFVLALIRMGLARHAAGLAQQAAQRVKGDLRARLVAGLADLSPGTPLPPAGAVAVAVSDHVEAIGPYIRRFLPLQRRLMLVPAALVLATLTVNWVAALVLVLTGPMIPLFMALVGMRAKTASEERHGELERLGGFLLDRIKGLETLRLFGALGRTEDDVAAAGTRFRVATMKVLRIAFLSSTVLELFSALGIAFVAIHVGFSLIGQIDAGTWGGPMTLAGGLFVLLLAPDFYAPLRAFATAYHDRASAHGAAEKLAGLPLETVRKLSDMTPETSRPVVTIRRDRPGPAAIGFEAVTLRLGGAAILDRVSFAVAPGERVLLEGRSGAGKTTLLDCLLGLHRPEAGRVTVDGEDLAGLDLARWRADLAWLSQEPRLFYGSLRANLLRARPDAGAAELAAALDLAGARALVEQLPRGLDTRIGEDGFGLSVGEARRIALARAALRTEARLMIADEPTAGLDADTAERVIAGLDALSRDRTVIIASHDPVLLARPGRLLRVGGGAVEEGRS